MSKNASPTSVKQRPAASSIKSFTRYEPAAPPATSSHRHRASTLNTPAPPHKSQDEDGKDVFTKSDSHEDEELSPTLTKSTTLPEKFDELPIELSSLIDRFVESLGAKSFDQPPSIDQISELFQEFYITASSRISIHISSLMTKLNREPSPAPSKTSLKSRTSFAKKSQESLVPDKTEGAQQMLTATEVTEKKKARKLLEYKRVLLEEAVEKRTCEQVYDKIWRHKSTLDEVRDEKLRSKTAALALVGIELKDLGIEFGPATDKTAEDIQDMLTPAREALMQMNDEHYPLGKLQHLKKAHKTIVDTLYSIQGSSSSADEILPTLIYTLVTSPVEGVNIISNLDFIQRFRGSARVDGETAYCLTNLEAAIGFLENVDLSSLRAEERPEGPGKSLSQPQTPSTDKPEPFPDILAIPPAAPATTITSTSSATGEPPVDSKMTAVKSMSTTRHQRTLSDILQPVTAANEAVQNKAKEGIETISNTLDNSFKFLFGRLKEQAADPAAPSDVIVPKTLDEARQLVNRPLGPDAVEEAIAASDASSIAEKDAPESPSWDKGRNDDRILSLFGGRKPGSIRERSVDSQKSNTSSRKVAFTQSSDASTATKISPMTTSNPTSNNPLDSIKNIGSSLNPLNQIGNAFGGGFRGFGRPAMPTAASLPSPQNTSARDKKLESGKENGKLALQVPMDEPDKVSRKIREAKPPISRYIETESAADLKVGEIQDLLNDYKRLATLLTELANGV